MKCLVLGADSLVGRHLMAALQAAGHTVSGTSRRLNSAAIGFDLAQPDLAALDRTRFDCALVCAAVTNMRTCEQAPNETRRINVDGTLAAMRHLAERGTHTVFLSSSQVFDGDTLLPDEDAARAPKNAYGRQKQEVEDAIAEERLPAAILRVTKVLADQPVGMFQLWYDSLLRGQPAVAATNLTVAPVTAADTAHACILLGAGRCTGAWHLSSSDEVSYHEAARRMVATCGLPGHLMQGADVTEKDVPAIYRHRHAAIASRRITDAFDLPVRPARDVLDGIFRAFASLAR